VIGVGASYLNMWCAEQTVIAARGVRSGLMAGSSTEQGPGGPRDDVVDASRRTHLANERTYLAWWRCGLTCLAVGLGAGRLLPSLDHRSRVPYELLGAGFALLGIGFIWFAFIRQRRVAEAVRRGSFEYLDDRLLAAFTAIGVLLGVLLFALVLIDS
jgi:putative membrane protein